LKLIFYNVTHHLDSLIDSKNNDSNNNTKNECPASSLKVLGEPLILRNINMARKKLNFDKVLIPNGLHNALRIVREAFPHIDVEEFNDDEKDDRRYNNYKNTERSITTSPSLLLSSSDPLYSKVIIGGKYEDFEIPLNACLHYSENIESLFIESIIFPWDFLNLVQKVLHEEVTRNMISPNASIAKSSIIEGPCLIEDDVKIDDFCKIKGPTYIGKGSFVGMSSLIRNCMFGNDTKNFH
jgi:UDP-N-acetylglucosamine diphosphorylase / glucose-1-phosphate thymidylyltransferase / UDP-N-acetylgalactosamine diphosphorylase / glucosamine-1-phosphate N-acetyltransferase / galactosamine-1-phosphate N-acetyltransferase